MSGFLSAGLFNAIPDSEDFEHNNLTGVYGGDTGDFNIQSSTVDEGSYALSGIQTSSASAIVRSTTEKWKRYGVRSTWRQYVPSSLAGGGNWACYTSVDGFSNVSGYVIYANENAVRIKKIENGSQSDLAVFGSAPTTGTWVDGSIDLLSDGTIDVTVDGLNVSVVDNTFTDVYPGFFSYNNGYIDDVQFSAI